MFSSWESFNRILDDPTAHGFETSDPTTSGGGIWFDALHPTSAVHKILAEDIGKFLESQASIV
jgi:phospholipase/lecithinase/hemolysin